MLFIIMAFPFQFLLETVLPQLLMGKDKKKHSKKDAASADVLDLRGVDHELGRNDG